MVDCSFCGKPVVLKDCASIQLNSGVPVYFCSNSCMFKAMNGACKLMKKGGSF